MCGSRGNLAKISTGLRTTIVVVAVSCLAAAVFLLVSPPFSPSRISRDQMASEDIHAIWNLLDVGSEVGPVQMPKGVLTGKRLAESVHLKHWNLNDIAFRRTIS